MYSSSISPMHGGHNGTI